jgi:hypothetical protein
MSQPGVAQVDDMVRFRDASTREMKPRFLGIVETTWSPAQAFLNSFYGIGPKRPEGQERGSAAQCFKDVFQRIDALGN